MHMATEQILHCSHADFLAIRKKIENYWGSDRTLSVHHPMFIFEFGNSAYVIKENNEIIAYLFGFLSQTSPTAYVHLVGVHKDHQSKGLGTKLYKHFIEFAQMQGCSKLKAITSPNNKQSINFHKKLGMSLIGTPDENGIQIFKDYSGEGQDRVVFEMTIQQ